MKMHFQFNGCWVPIQFDKGRAHLYGFWLLNEHTWVCAREHAHIQEKLRYSRRNTLRIFSWPSFSDFHSYRRKKPYLWFPWQCGKRWDVPGPRLQYRDTYPCGTKQERSHTVFVLAKTFLFFSFIIMVAETQREQKNSLPHCVRRGYNYTSACPLELRSTGTAEWRVHGCSLTLWRGFPSRYNGERVYVHTSPTLIQLPYRRAHTYACTYARTQSSFRHPSHRSTLTAVLCDKGSTYREAPPSC